MCRNSRHATVSVAALVLLALVGTAAADASTPLPTLVFTDNSPGAGWIVLGLEMNAQSQGRPFTCVTDVAALTAQLASDRRYHVVVAMQHATQEPDCARVIRDYLTRQPDGEALLMIWHPNNTQPPANTDVLASTSIYFWSIGQTAAMYALADPDPTAGTSATSGIETRTLPGYVWPDFNGILLRAPKVSTIRVAGAAPQPGPGQAQQNCYLECLAAWGDAMQTCSEAREARIGRCYQNYGPTETQPPSEDLLGCLSRANASHTNCMSDAFNDHNECRTGCDAGVVLTPIPTGPSNP
jgi:hypothetical protein